ncbi:MAG: ECF-type sigma factor [Bryobacteraceae bacterium]|jgi:RNA polymerase sigma factor (TIGR02999 family)
MAPMASSETISGLMAALRRGDKDAANRLVEIFYPQLRRLANARMQREQPGHSWQATLLVNELYLELIKIKALPAPEIDNGDGRAAFFGLAAHLMRRLLIHHSRPLAAKAVKLELTDSAAVSGTEAIAEIEVALSRLEALRPRLRAIVELKAFEGMTLEEVADRLGCSTATVTRDWNFARHWLQRELGGPAPGLACNSHTVSS